MFSYAFLYELHVFTLFDMVRVCFYMLSYDFVCVYAFWYGFKFYIRLHVLYTVVCCFTYVCLWCIHAYIMLVVFICVRPMGACMCLHVFWIILTESLLDACDHCFVLISLDIIGYFWICTWNLFSFSRKSSDSRAFGQTPFRSKPRTYKGKRNI